MNYKILVSFFVPIICVTSSTTVNSQQKTAETNKNHNSIITTAQKMQTFYAMPMVHQQLPSNYLQQPYAPQQATILFIAQPVSPHQLFQHPVAQQLLNYFHSNPQAKYQFLHGPSPTAQSYIQEPIPNTYATHQSNQINYPQPPQIPQYTAPRHLLQEHLYQNLQNLQNYQQHPGHPTIKTAPPIITGLEHFSQEQQAQIKEQLSSHFGSQLTQINPNSFQVSRNSQNKYKNDEHKVDTKKEETEKRHLGSYLSKT